MLGKPFFSAPIADQSGLVGRSWRGWLQDLQQYIGHKPFPIKSYTVSTLPDASIFESHLVYVSDETGGATVAFSDGTDWRRVQDRVVVS